MDAAIKQEEGMDVYGRVMGGLLGVAGSIKSLLLFYYINAYDSIISSTMTIMNASSFL